MDKVKKNEAPCRAQFGALPYRFGEKGLDILLVTSRETKRWVIPKGWPIKALKPHAAARREAYEEAGLVGEIGKRSVGSYSYDKRLKSRETVPCEVEVFPLAVERQLKRWPEKAEREARWFPAAEAAELVAEPELGDIIRAFDERLGKSPGPAA